MAKNVILLGGSNAAIKDGLNKGLQKANEKILNNAIKLDFINLAWGASASLCKLFVLEKNQNILSNAELIIIETNINEYDMFAKVGLSFQTLARNLEFVCKFLAKLKAKILWLILPLHPQEKENFAKIKIVDNFNRLLIKKYGFNCIDIQAYYEAKGVNEFFVTSDYFHQLHSIMRILGHNIIENISKFKQTKTKAELKNPKFLIKKVHEIFDLEGIELESKKLENSMFKETFYKLDDKTRLKFKKEFMGYELIGLTICNIFEQQGHYNIFSSYILQNKKNRITKGIRSSFYLFYELDERFIIDDESFMYFNINNEKITEGSVWMNKHLHFTNNLHHCGLDAFLLMKNDENVRFYEPDIHVLENEVLQIPAAYDFSTLVPPVEIYKEIIEEYCAHMDGRKLAPLQNENANLRTENKKLNDENSTLKNELNSLPRQINEQELVNLKLDENVKKLEVKKLEKELGMKLSKLEPRVNLILSENLRVSAVARVRNHLAYRLGAAIIVCNKNLWGLASLPFVLSFIKNQYKKEQAAYQSLIKQRPELKLPALENYADYKAALKEKECFTYKLGLALMRADKTWLLGSYIKFYFEAKRLEKEFKNTKEWKA